jgi:predicted deacylase
VAVGASVRAGQPAGALHDPAAPWREATEFVFAQDGIVLCRRHPTRTEIGDCLYNLGTPTS